MLRLIFVILLYSIYFSVLHPVFFPPELYRYKKHYAEPSTVWSLGFLLYSMLGGEVPFCDQKEIVQCIISFPEHLSVSVLPECQIGLGGKC